MVDAREHERQQRVGGAGLFGVGEGHRREVGVGAELVCDGVHIVEAGQMQCAQRQFAADAVHGGQRHPH